ncbi:MAG: hypothetical protein KAS12_07390 [Candidatus Aenigmarchaeota archaeon]|nr:hypothetical protein [Candidatus Aenigmarchaeota archaeon]
MILEIINAFREAIVAIVMSAINTAKIVVGAFVKAARIFKAQAGSSNYLETITVVLLFSLIGYFIYKFLWNSAKTFALFLGLIMFLFVLTVLLV